MKGGRLFRYRSPLELISFLHQVFFAHPLRYLEVIAYQTEARYLTLKSMSEVAKISLL